MCGPLTSETPASCACPFTSLTLPPSCVAGAVLASKKVTLPVGVVEPVMVGATVAVSVVVCSGVMLLGLTPSVVTEACCRTVNCVFTVNPDL